MKRHSYSVIAGLVILLFAVGATAAERWEVWPKVNGASALVGDAPVGVYSDPNFKNDLLLFPGCWLIRRDAKEVFEANCPFKIENDDLLFDSTWRSESGRLGGVVWDDQKRDVSFFSMLFRRPEFLETTVKFWSGSKWVNIMGLPVAN